MKRIITILAIATLCQVTVFGQKKYEMVIEKTDGSEIAVNVEDIVRTYFRERANQDFTLSTYTVEMTIGETKMVDILSGSGWFNTETSNSSIVTVASSGNAISLAGMGAGTAAVTVTDVRYDVTQQITVTVTSGNATLTSCPDSNHPHMIDMGLPSGTKWACCNVGAITPEGYGSYYAWGETQPKSVYNWDTYQFGYYNDDGDFSHLVIIGYKNADTAYYIGYDIAGTAYDAATANWGAPWRLPTEAQCQELREKCTSVWTTQNGVKGCMVTGPNGGTIFLPAAGYRWNGELLGHVHDGCYLSSTQCDWPPSGTFILVIDDYSGTVGIAYDCPRCAGLSVRPVR